MSEVLVNEIRCDGINAATGERCDRFRGAFKTVALLRRDAAYFEGWTVGLPGDLDFCSDHGNGSRTAETP